MTALRKLFFCWFLTEVFVTVKLLRSLNYRSKDSFDGIEKQLSSTASCWCFWNDFNTLSRICLIKAASLESGKFVEQVTLVRKSSFSRKSLSLGKSLKVQKALISFSASELAILRTEKLVRQCIKTFLNVSRCSQRINVKSSCEELSKNNELILFWVFFYDFLFPLLASSTHPPPFFSFLTLASSLFYAVASFPFLKKLFIMKYIKISIYFFVAAVFMFIFHNLIVITTNRIPWKI